MMVTFAFPLYFKNVICGGEAYGDALWGASISVSMLLVAVVSPVLGASADYSGRRKRFLFSFTILSVAATALLSFAGPGMAVYAILLFVLANIGFEGGLVFYDSYLKEITSEKALDGFLAMDSLWATLERSLFFFSCVLCLRGGFRHSMLRMSR